MFRFIRRTRRLIRGILVSFVVLAVLVAGGGWYWLDTSLPSLSGRIVLPGLVHDAEVIYDANGIPHIRAASIDDAYRALGFVHARDRLFQMDFMRRLAAGRLSEVIGPQTLRIDKTMRTLGIYRLAEETFRLLPPALRRHLQAYADGVNAYLSTRDGALPPEFIALGYTPEKWRPADSLVWGRLMALRLSGNRRTEALRMALGTRLPAGRIEDLWPRDDDAPPPTIDAAGTPARLGPMFASLLDALPPEIRRMSDSNSWAVDGKHTASGRPILANDPHLGYRAPIMWYLAQVSAPGLDVTGATVPGVPFTVLGHNDRIAWAFTSTESDTQDLFVERLTAGRPGAYDTPNGPLPFTTRTERIAIKGRAPASITIRETRHGPVVSDLDSSLLDLAGTGKVVALAATALLPDDRTAEALFGMNVARDWPSFRTALRDFQSPQQNITYADVDGNIGFMAPGRVPVRKSGDGSVPVPGSTGAYDWNGFIPFDDLPQAFNPASGRIVNANNRIVPRSYKWLLTRDWPPPYRARRIYEMLGHEARQNIATTVNLQTDVRSDAAAAVLPVLIGLASAASDDDRERDALSILRDWNYEMRRDLAAPLIFTAWLAEVNRGLYADELGPLFRSYYGLHPRVVLEMLVHRQEWCDDITTPERETCGQIVSQALDRALSELSAKYGDKMLNWRWGKAHQAVFDHPVFGRIPVLRNFADLAIASDGGAFTVNRGQMRISDARAPFASVHGPGLRAIYDLSDLDNSRFALATGESGNPLSSRYGNLMLLWRDGRYLRIPTTRAEAEKDAKGIVTLVPQ